MKVPGLGGAVARGGVRGQRVTFEHGDPIKVSRERLGCREPAHARTDHNHVFSNRMRHLV